MKALLAVAMVLCLSACTPTPHPTLAPEPSRNSASPIPSSPVIAAPTDLGPRKQANGTAILDADGTVTAYVVSEGDVPLEIAQRFGLESLGQLRNADGIGIGDNIQISPDERLTVLPNK